jgi:2-polyprenyl-3-methyl-5-hydroxy-6-metoxy-1,4-benzoquinol methylase
MENKKQHWENVFTNKAANEVSWYEPKPIISLQFLQEYNIAKTAAIIDIGGGDSFLVDNLLELGYQNITVLDISEAALNKAKTRLAEKAAKVKWIVADAADFTPTEQYDFWHDRAAFHFLTTEIEIENYITTIKQSITTSGVLVIGTFSEDGPKKCSGIEIKQYSETTMTEKLKKYFNKIKCITVDHLTPFNTLQNFIFCSFKKFNHY